MWKKLGRIFVADGQHPWMRTHIAMPVPLHLTGEYYRIYFGTRSNNNQPHIGFIEFDINNPNKILRVSENYSLGPGPIGFFDENGVYPGPIIKQKNQLLMYYIGRSNGLPPIFYMAIGLAISNDGGETFNRFRDAPIMDRSQYDPWMVSTPWVIYDNDKWRMWYLSGLGWQKHGAKKKSLYHIKYAESTDGIHWIRHGHIAIDLRPGETNIAAPCILKSSLGYEMWYCYVKDTGYKIGYAVSTNGCDWIRKDEAAGIELSDQGWDSECMAYPSIFVHKDRKYLLYSGNNNGKEGMGIAFQKL